MVNTYLLNRELNELHVICCRLLLGLMPGLETSVVFQENVCGKLISNIFENQVHPIET